MDEEIFKLQDHGKQLWTRPKGAEIRAHLDKKLQEMHPGDVLIIDLSGVQVFDVSFAAEFFLKTALNLQAVYKGLFVVLENLEEHCRETLVTKLEKENLIMLERVSGQLRLLGKVPPQYQETMNVIVRSNKPISSSILGETLGVNQNAMNERLKKLTNFSLIRRDKGVSQAGREEFLYSKVI